MSPPGPAVSLWVCDLRRADWITARNAPFSGTEAGARKRGRPHMRCDAPVRQCVPPLRSRVPDARARVCVLVAARKRR